MMIIKCCLFFFQKWLPNNDSAILIEEFQSPKHLAEHLLILNNNDDKYNQYLAHKLNQMVSNEKLQKQLQQRGYETNSIVEDFECYICQKSVGKLLNDKQTKPAYDTCTENLIYPRMRSKGNTREKWQSIFRQGKCESMLFSELVKRNQSYSQEYFQKELLKRYNNHSCDL